MSYYSLGCLTCTPQPLLKETVRECTTEAEHAEILVCSRRSLLCLLLCLVCGGRRFFLLLCNYLFTFLGRKLQKLLVFGLLEAYNTLR